MTLCLCNLSIITLTFLGQETLGITSDLLFLCENVAFFPIGMGHVCCVLASEIFPLRLQAKASGAWGGVCSGLVAMSFLSNEPPSSSPSCLRSTATDKREVARAYRV
ncbi:hypothetical protein F2Q70_00032619 [Brassica cretica]|uniref:Major facilitator superfamily (MFS) profile domain-containing protein n=1 Tax=Brassica cretica TaxID=69181 RepID=A0A8S9FC18_BRACR|nr:hypothetical protein F2Q70_00032619 [Brassica cretica]